MTDPSSIFLIRVDANSTIGSGHMMRCLSIAQHLRDAGCDVVFAVSDEESAILPSDCGFCTIDLSSDCTRWDESDGFALSSLASDTCAKGILIDSYAVTDSFFSRLHIGCGAVPVGYIDDLYTFELGRMRAPVRRQVDSVFNYGFFRCASEYYKVYSDSAVRLCLGLEYAPIRTEFAQGPFTVSEEVKRILITTGSTNPERTLERMAACAHQTLPNATVDVIVGSMSEYDANQTKSVVLHRGVRDLFPLMAQADIAVSAAGTTLYELCAVGLPTIAVPIVDNQMPNTEGFASNKLGPMCPKGDFDEILCENLGLLSTNKALRASISKKMQGAVDGDGSLRIAKELLN